MASGRLTCGVVLDSVVVIDCCAAMASDPSLLDPAREPAIDVHDHRA